MWKCRSVESLEIQKQDFHSSHRPWKSLRDSHIPTRTTVPLYSLQDSEPTLKKCYLCPRIIVLPMFPVGHAGSGSANGRQPRTANDSERNARRPSSRVASRYTGEV
jgi:hypothetical protein